MADSRTHGRARLRTSLAALTALVLMSGVAIAKDGQPRVTVAIGGAGCLCYLPTVLAKQLGEYENAGIVEQAVDLEREISVLVARSPMGEVRVYPAAWNHHEEQILAWSVMPAPLSLKMAAEARVIAEAIADTFQLEGILAVELFCTRDGRLLVRLSDLLRRFPVALLSRSEEA